MTTAAALARLLEKYPADPDVRALAGMAPDVAERDRLLREAAERFWPGKSAHETAGHMHRALLRYHATTWKSDRRRTEPPAHPRAAMWFRTLQAKPVVPGERTIRRILATNSSNGQWTESSSNRKETK